jgi:phenylacetaldehyde dehydrogenase
MNTIVAPETVNALTAKLSAGPQPLFVGGRPAPAKSGRTFDVFNPATGERLAKAAAGGREDIDAAVGAARTAFESGPWATMPPSERSKLIWRLADAIEAKAPELALLETLDNGMPYMMALHVAVPMATESLRYFAGWPTKLNGSTPPISAPGEWHAYTVRQPVGVVGQIVPWNFPLSMACGKLGAALAAGCTVVLKPAEQTPLSTVRLAEIIHEVGFPDGVVNIVTGLGTEAGQALIDHPDVDMISFTGSTATGKAILAVAARDLKRVTLELGGKSPNIIFADADLDRAIEAAAMGAFFNTGQVCVARSRLFVHEKVYDRVVGGISGFAANLKVGSGLAADSMLGPLVSQAQLERVTRYISLGAEEGGEIVAGGKRLDSAGYFVQPTVIAGANPNARVMREEIFGPVVCVVPFGDDLEDVVRRANDTDYGLAASIWTSNISIAHKLARRIKAGTIDINGMASPHVTMPFGGFKQSGIGRENGREGVEAYTELKSVNIEL